MFHRQNKGPGSNDMVNHAIGVIAGVSVRCGKKPRPACTPRAFLVGIMGWIRCQFATARRHLRPARKIVTPWRDRCPIMRNPRELHQERKAASETGEWRRPFGKLVHFSPKGIVAVSQYRIVGVNFIPSGGPIRAHFWEAWAVWWATDGSACGKTITYGS